MSKRLFLLQILFFISMTQAYEEAIYMKRTAFPRSARMPYPSREFQTRGKWYF